MSWLSNPLKFAGDLLDSVDRSAQTVLEDGEAKRRSTDRRAAEGSGHRYVPRRERRRGAGASGPGSSGGASLHASSDPAAAQPNSVASTDASAARGGDVGIASAGSGLGARRLHGSQPRRSSPPPTALPAAAPVPAASVDDSVAGSASAPAVALSVAPALRSKASTHAEVGSVADVAPGQGDAGSAAAADGATPADTADHAATNGDGDGADTSAGATPSGGAVASAGAAAAEDGAGASAPVPSARTPSRRRTAASHAAPMSPPRSDEAGAGGGVGGVGGGGGDGSASAANDATHAALLRRLGLRDKQVEALRGEVSHLNLELDELDRQMVAAQARLDKGAETEEELRAQLKDALAEARQARRDAERLARQTADVDVGAVERLRSDLAAAQAEAESLNKQLDAKTSQHAHALQALRREVRAAETAAQDASNDAAVARAAAQRREEELLNESSELQRALAQAQAALEKKAGAMASLTSSSSIAEAEADLRREAANAAEAALMAERRQNSTMRRDVRELTEKTAKLQVSLEEARRQNQALQAERNATVARLEKRVVELGSSAQQDRPAQLEARLRTMAESVVSKQGIIDELRSEKAALERRLQRESALRKEAEDAADDLYGGGGDRLGGSSAIDVEAGGGYMGSRSTPTLKRRGRGIRHRLMAASPAISKLQPIAQNPKVAKAIDVVDRITLRTGFFLSREPLARLLFLLYLLVLHLWALFILAFHTHRLDHPSSSSVASPPFVQSRS